MTERRMPRWRDIEPFPSRRRTSGDRVARRLARCVCIADLERAARRRVPPAVWDYVAGGSDGETAMRRNAEAFGRVELRPTAFGQREAAPGSSSI